MRPIRSVRPVPTFSTRAPASSFPEYTRKYVSLPTYGSAAILNASAANGSESSALRTTSRSCSSPLISSVPTTGGTSSGEGR